MAFQKNKPVAAPAAPVAPAAEAAAPATANAPLNGTSAAVSRLKKADLAPVGKTPYQSRDYDKEARGKTRCVQFEAALMSQAIPGMKFDTMAEYLDLCRQAADYGVAYTFDELPK